MCGSFGGMHWRWQWDTAMVPTPASCRCCGTESKTRITRSMGGHSLRTAYKLALKFNNHGAGMSYRLSLSILVCLAFAGCEDASSESADNATAADKKPATASTNPTTDTNVAATKPESQEMSGPLSFEMETLAGEKVALAKYSGNVVLIVNVASKCGLTPQYEQLQALHKKYAGQGLSVVGVPCNQFGGQEPGSADDIQQFCSKNYGVEFDMLAKVEVNGDGACELYKYLTALETKPQGAGNIGWNFEKFLIDRSGNVIHRFSPRTSPDADEIVQAIETALAATP